MKYLAVILLSLTCCGFVKAQSDTCANGDSLVLNTSLKRYQCITPGAQPAGTGTTMLIANAAVTGTTVNRFAKLTGAPSTAVVTATSDTENAVGIVTAGAGTTGNVTITILGQASCQFDGATTAGNYVILSSVTAGMCHDGGSSYPTSGAAYGRVLSTNGGAATYVIELMTPDIAFQNAGNGKSRPGGVDGDYQYNGTGNTSAGGSLKREDANTNAQRNGVTAQTFNFYKLFNSDSNFIRLKVDTNATNGVEILADAQNQTVPNLSLRVSGSTDSLQLHTGILQPSSNRSHNLGQTGKLFNQVNAYQFISDNASDTSGGGFSFSGGPLFYKTGTGQMEIRDQAGAFNLIRLGLGQANVNVSFVKPANAQYIQSRNGENTADVFHTMAGNEFTSAQFDKAANTTLSDVTGLVSEALTAGRTYTFNAELFVDADVVGGSKYAIAGTATATAIKYEIIMLCDATGATVISSRQTALGGNVGQVLCTAGLTRITGTITVNAAGTLAVQFAQNVASGTSSVLTMSKLEVRQLN